MTTLQKIRGAVQRLQQTHIPKAKARRFFLGVEQFAFQEFTVLVESLA